MYRYNIDNTVTYTPDDLDLFRESPFALWMERLTLENPDHGILPDVTSSAALEVGSSPPSLVETLRAEGKQVATIDPGLDEPERREVTLAAMHEGADFIADGQLAVGAFSATTQLLMRTSGYSELGDFLYIPCEPETSDSFHSGYRLAFIANLLHTMQGQLPPQLLIIRDGTDVVPLQTEDHIHYYRSVLRRFEEAMKGFRKHRMPDPSESSHFGRWSDCASEVLKQRAQSEQARNEEDLEAQEELEERAAEELEIPPLLVAAGAAAPQEAVARSVPSSAWWTADTGMEAAAGLAHSPRADAGPTLAEQARMLQPGSYSAGEGPGHTPNLARFPRPAPAKPEAEQAAQEEGPVEVEALYDTAPLPLPQVIELPVDATLENLEFIGSRDMETPPETEGAEAPEEDWSAPAASLRAGVPDEPLKLDDSLELDEPVQLRETLELDEPLELDESGQLDESLQLPQPGMLDEEGREVDVPQFLPPDPTLEQSPSVDIPPPVTGESGYTPPPMVDLDSAPAPALVPVRPVRPKNRAESDTPDSEDTDHDEDDGGDIDTSPPPFDDRLDTSTGFEDED